MMAINLTSKDLVKQRLPHLKPAPHETRNESTQNIYFRSTLGQWNGFEMQVRQNFLATRWGDNPPTLAYAPPNSHKIPEHTFYEQLFCGDEHSVVARFGQNAGHVMTSVFRSLGIPYRFADYKASEAGSNAETVPDLALIQDSGQIRALGEAKTPWMHDIYNNINGRPNEFRRDLGESVKVQSPPTTINSN